MSAILPAEHYRQFPRAPRAQLLSNLFLAQEKKMAMTPLEEIISKRRLSALFQPVMDMQNGECLGYEGLIRGPSESALHLPVHLFDTAEQENLSLEVEMLSRQIVLETFAKLDLHGKLFLNVSPETLTHPSFKNDQTLAFLNKLEIDPQRVIIEITENQPTFDFEAMRGALLHYRAMGFQIAIDDLGEGFSSLRLWSELRPEFIKIDKHFVSGADQNPIKLQFLKSIQSIAESCGTNVIAEGVETEAELQLVKNIGIALGQGYFIGRPSPTPPLIASDKARRVINAANIVVTRQAELPHRAHTKAFKLMSYVEPVQPDTLIDQIFDRFNADSALHIIPLVHNTKPLGLINRYHFIDRYAKPFQRELHGKKPCSEIITGAPLLVEKNMPIEELSHFLSETDSRHFADGFIITEGGRYIGVASGQDLLRELTQMQLEAARYANPLTLLPGNVPINDHIERLLQNNSAFVACYCDLDYFKPFNDTYSYREGDEMIRLTGRILNGACDPKRDFIGHIGGDDFILLMQSRDWKTRCEQALRTFGQSAARMFQPAHLQASGYSSEGRDGVMKFHPLTSLSIGAIQVTPGKFASHHEVSAAMSDAKKMAKKISGNSLFVEQRNAGSKS